MTQSSTSFANTFRRYAHACASLPGAMCCGSGAGIGIGSVGDLIL